MLMDIYNTSGSISQVSTTYNDSFHYYCLQFYNVKTDAIKNLTFSSMDYCPVSILLYNRR